jgi:hypothetical protein
VPEPTWQEILLSQGLLLAGAATRFAVAWLAARTARLENEE